MQTSEYIFKYASKEIQNDKEVVLKVVESDRSALQYASDELKNDKEFGNVNILEKDHTRRY